MNYDDELRRTADRLRQLSVARLTPKQQQFHHLLTTMTDRPVPRIASHAWGDQLLVIGRDVAEDDRARLAAELVAFRRSLDLAAGS